MKQRGDGITERKKRTVQSVHVCGDTQVLNAVPQFVLCLRRPPVLNTHFLLIGRLP